MKIAVIIFIFLNFSISIFCQTKPANKSSYNYFQKAQIFFYKNDTINAIKFAEKSIAKDLNYTEPYILVAQIYFQNKNYLKAAEYFKIVLNISPSYFTIYSWLANSYVNIDNYDEAINVLLKYVSIEKNENLINEALNKIEIYKFRQFQIQNPTKIYPVRLDEAINTSQNEYFPTITAENNTILFTREIERQEDIYISYKREYTWTNAISVSPVINTPFNEGAHCLSADGMQMYFTRCTPEGGCDIYYTIKDESGYWMPPKPVSFVNSRYWETQPCLSADNKKLFFVSNRPGGFGKMDIWCSNFIDNQWSIPYNIGKQINTNTNEMSPFIHFDNKTFYFASDGHIGMGGFDIFTSKMIDDTTFSEPLNLGFPINNKTNQFRLVVDAAGQFAYYSFQTDSIYGQDIYKIELPLNLRPQPIIYVKVKFIDYYTNKPVKVNIINVINLNTGDTIFFISNTSNFLACMPQNNTYLLNALAKGYNFYSENFDLNNFSDTSSNYEFEVFLKPIFENSLINLKNIYFQTNSYVIDNKSFFELDNIVKFMKLNANISIQINGHTDSVGTYNYNIELSEKRAKSVVEYLQNKGIDKNRMTYKGYGYTKPIAENQSQEGKKLNRRTEILILKK